jgi:hypothetical protein
MTVFISGKISGEPYEKVKEKFVRAEFVLRRKGYTIVNPIRFVPPTATHEQAMKLCIANLAGACDTIYMLNDWEQSEGAVLEHLIAKACGIRIIYEDVC